MNNNNIENTNKLGKQPAESSIDKQTPDRDFNKYYRTWWSEKNEHYQGAGVGLAIKQELAKRVYKIEYIDGRALLADLQLKKNIKIRIIVVYMPADPKYANERSTLINQIEK
jgi:exonuclease III